MKYKILKTRQFHCFCLITNIKDGSIKTKYIFIKCKSRQRETIIFDTFAYYIYIQTQFFTFASAYGDICVLVDTVHLYLHFYRIFLYEEIH